MITALTGIDGSGKTMVTARLCSRAGIATVHPGECGDFGPVSLSYRPSWSRARR